RDVTDKPSWAALRCRISRRRRGDLHSTFFEVARGRAGVILPCLGRAFFRGRGRARVVLPCLVRAVFRSKCWKRIRSSPQIVGSPRVLYLLQRQPDHWQRTYSTLRAARRTTS